MKRLPDCREMSVGETITEEFDGESYYSVRLIGVEPYFEPFYQSGAWFNIFWKARVDVEVNGIKASLWCKPYQLPVNVAGLNLSVDLVKGVEGGLYSCQLAKDIRFSARDAKLPWITEKYCFPIVGYKWRCSNYAHTWNGFVSVNSQAKMIYYHRGEDFGAVPDRLMFTAMDDSVMERVPGESGDQDSNHIITKDKDYQYCYSHANAPFPADEFYKGRELKKGEAVKLTGNTWNGRPVRDPHLHISIGDHSGTEQMNTFFPLLYAYKNSYPDELLVTAEGFRFCKEGDTITLDASAAEEINGNKELDYVWELSDGTKRTGMRVSVCYPQPGTYTEKVIVSDRTGRRGVDHVIVSVFSTQGSERPFCWLNVYPMRAIKVMDDVEFLVGFYNMDEAVIDFGDGATEKTSDGQRHFHSYSVPRYYTISVIGAGPGGPGIFKLEILVEESDECRNNTGMD